MQENRVLYGCRYRGDLAHEGLGPSCQVQVKRVYPYYPKLLNTMLPVSDLAMWVDETLDDDEFFACVLSRCTPHVPRIEMPKIMTRFVQGHVVHLEDGVEMMDTCVAWFQLHHHHLDTILQRVYDHLRPEGCFLIGEWDVRTQAQWTLADVRHQIVARHTGRPIPESTYTNKYELLFLLRQVGFEIRMTQSHDLYFTIVCNRPKIVQREK